MKKEFKAVSGKVYGEICVGAFGIFTIAWIVSRLNLNNTLMAILAVLSILPVAGIFFYALVKLKRRIVIDDERIISTGLFRTEVLFISQVKGFRRLFKTLTIIPQNPDSKKIEINEEYIEYDALKDWVIKTFADLDAADLNNDGQHPIGPRNVVPVEPGTESKWPSAMSPENAPRVPSGKEGESTLETVRKRVRVLNTVSIIAGIAACGAMATIPPGNIPPLYAKTLLAFCLALPLIGLYIYRSSNGMINLEYERKSERPSLSLTFAAPMIILAMNTFMDNNMRLVSYVNILRPALAILAVMALLFYFSIRSSLAEIEKSNPRRLFFLVLTFAAFYAYVSVTTTNWVFNATAPVEYSAKVLEKIEPAPGDEYPSHYLRVSEWGPFKEDVMVKTPIHLFINKKPGDTVTLYLYTGLFNVPYYMIGK